MNDIEDEILLVIVMTNKAERKLEDMGIGDIEGQLQAIDNIRLYKIEDKTAKNPEDSGEKYTVALPLKSGDVLLLRKDEEDNYFVCPTIVPFPPSSVSSAYCHELPSNVRCRVASGKVPRSYLRSAVDCDHIRREVFKKELWLPFEGGGPEGKKWKAYLDLYKNVVEGQCFGLPVGVRNIINGKTAEIIPDFSGMSDNDSAEIKEKITKARNNEVSFSLTLEEIEISGENHPKRPFGILKSFNNGGMKIELKEDFYASLEDAIKTGITEGILYPEGPVGDGKSIISSGSEKPVTKEENTDKESETADDTEQESNANESEMTVDFTDVEGWPYLPCKFYYDPEKKKPAFSCNAVRDKYIWRIKSDSIIPHQVMLFAEFIGDLSQIKVMKDGLVAIKDCPIWPVLSGERVAKLPEIEDISWESNCRLNEQQKDAVRKALGARELCLIWGPPGTGKTEVIMEIAQREAARGNKTLIVSQANLAVDNALARMGNKPGVWAFRIAKEDYKLEEDDKSKVPMQETAGEFLSRWLQNRLCEESDLPEDIAALRKDLSVALKKTFRSDTKKSGDKRLEREMPQMAELYRRRINVVGATLMYAGKVVSERDPETGKKIKGTEQKKLCKNVGIEEFDTVIVDEVSKATPPELFLPALLGKRLVLVGDHKQLPPMLKLISGDDLSLKEWAKMADVSPAELESDSTLFEDLWKKHDKEADDVRAKLTVQYRMHEKIQRLIETFYAGSEGDDSDKDLTCGLTNEEMAEMAIASAGCLAGHHAVWVDTEYNAMERRSGTSFVNDNEVVIVGKLLEELPNDEKLSVGVITFYGAQLGQLRDKYEARFSKKFPGKLIFGTVDRFQGRECDVVICSLVRNNKWHNIGFAAKPNRINVAFSRARRLLCIVGNSGQFRYGADEEESGELKEARSIYTKTHKACKTLSEGNLRDNLHNTILY